MADMYGALRSNWFTPVDADACKRFLAEEVNFGESEIFDNGEGRLAIGCEGQYPCAHPMVPMDDDGNYQEWDLEAFATEMRKHLAPGEAFRVFAAGHEKLRYVAATHLIVTHEAVSFKNYSEGN